MTRHKAREFTVLVLTTMLAACASEDPQVSGGTSLSECEDQSVRESVALDDETDLGFSAMDVLQGRLESSGTLTWRGVDPNVAVMTNLKADATAYHLSAAPGDTASVVRGVNGPCFDRIEVPVRWQFVTDDEQLNEDGDGLIVATTPGQASFTNDNMLASTIQGTLEITPAPGMSDPRFRLSTDWYDRTPMGFVTVAAEGPNKLSSGLLAEFSSQ